MSTEDKRKEYSKRYYEKHKEECKKRTKEHPSCIKARKKYFDKPETKSRIRNYRLLVTYGITNQDYERMLEEQHFCCAGCGVHQNKINKKLNVDHCHQTGIIRGLLCGSCNRALGLIKDNQQTLISLLAYLKKYHGA